MKLRYLLFICLIILSIVILPALSAVHAQDELTCEQTLEMATTAFDEGDSQTASDLTTTALEICANEIVNYRAAFQLQDKIQAEIDAANQTEMIEDATPGLVNVGDYSLFMTCEGTGSPTVILENGLGMDINTWDDVYPSIAEVTQVCRYGRLGVGLSDSVPSGATNTTFDQAEDLHQLLEIAEIEPPYVFAGHSISGLMLITYAHMYPEDMAGVVFVDSSHPDQWTRFAELDGVEVGAGVMGAERLDIDATVAQLASEETGDLGDMPVVVLTANMNEARERDQIWLELQADHAARSTNSQHIVSERSGHFVQNDEPEVVIDSILWVLSEIRGETVSLPPQLIEPLAYMSQFKNRDADYQLIDVRTPGEFAEGHLEGAINIPVQELDQHLDEVTSDKPIVLYCRSGNRSGQAAEILDGAGFVNIFDIDGGILAWDTADLPIIVDN